MMTQTVGRHRRAEGAAPSPILHQLLLDHTPSHSSHVQSALRDVFRAIFPSEHPDETTLYAMYFRRHCYDKPHRCPGWVGGGRRFPKAGKEWCDGGSLEITWEKSRYYENDPWLIWRWHRCNTCGVRAIPIAVKYLDPLWWYSCQLAPFFCYLGQDLDDLLKDGDWAWFWKVRKPQIRLWWKYRVKQWFERLGRWRRKDYERD